MDPCCADSPTRHEITNNTLPNYSPLPQLKFITEPISKIRFRNEGECKFGVQLFGRNKEEKNYPTIEITGNKNRERIMIIISCVTANKPYQAHPYKLVSKNPNGICKNGTGICEFYVQKEHITIKLNDLRIQSVKRNCAQDSLELRGKQRVGPPPSNADKLTPHDYASVRLYVQGFIKSDSGSIIPLTPVISEPISDKRMDQDLQITHLSQASTPAKGKQNIILLCEKVLRGNIEVHFFDDNCWVEKIKKVQVHKQTAITLETPPYKDQNINKTVNAYIQLFRPSDKATSVALPFSFTPNLPKYPKIHHCKSCNEYNINNNPIKPIQEPVVHQSNYINLPSTDTFQQPLLDVPNISDHIPLYGNQNTNMCVSDISFKESDIQRSHLNVFQTDQNKTINSNHSPTMYQPYIIEEHILQKVLNQIYSTRTATMNNSQKGTNTYESINGGDIDSDMNKIIELTENMSVSSDSNSPTKRWLQQVIGSP